jgi:hypothetical protein
VEYFFRAHLLATLEFEKQKPDQLSLLKGNPAILRGPNGFPSPPRDGFGFDFFLYAKNKKPATR